MDDFGNGPEALSWSTQTINAARARASGKASAGNTDNWPKKHLARLEKENAGILMGFAQLPSLFLLLLIY